MHLQRVWEFVFVVHPTLKLFGDGMDVGALFRLLHEWRLLLLFRCRPRAAATRTSCAIGKVNVAEESAQDVG